MFREALPAEGEPLYPRRFDLLIVDEAHNVAPAGSGKYARDSVRTAAMRLLAPHFEHKLFLTATPHNGYPESFSALLELLDNQRFARGVRPAREQLGAVMVRRLKDELPANWDGSRQFPKREIAAIEVRYSEDERNAHRLLRQYTQLRHERAEEDDEKLAVQFVLKLLKKRLFSSPAAFADTLAQHEKSIITPQRERARGTARPTRKLLEEHMDRVDEEYADDADKEEATDDAVEVASRLLAESGRDDRELIRKMQDWARQARTRPDSKTTALLDWLKANIKPNGKWSEDRVIIFTEYRATQKWPLDILAREGFVEGNRLMLLYGGMETDKREATKAAFQAGPRESDVRILLATDAASEGIDLREPSSKLGSSDGGGAFGLLATNTIAQGDTREVGWSRS
jgi:superfamily II DNA or RNA helicase